MTVAYDLRRRLAAEALGTALLVATVVGSGVMAQSLTQDVALMLLGNALATGAVPVVLITTLGPISGAHFNPAVSLCSRCGGSCRPGRPGGMPPHSPRAVSPARSSRT